MDITSSTPKSSEKKISREAVPPRLLNGTSSLPHILNGISTPPGSLLVSSAYILYDVFIYCISTLILLLVALDISKNNHAIHKKYTFIYHEVDC